MADALSRDFDLAWGKLMGTLESHFPSGSGYQIWDPAPQFVEAVLMALVRKRQSPECLLVEPPLAQQQTPGMVANELEWPSIPTSKPSRVKYATYKKANDEFIREDYHTHRIPSGLDRLKVT